MTTIRNFRNKHFLSILIITCTFHLLSICKAEENIKIRKTDSLQYSWEKFSVSIGGFITGLSTDILYGSEQLGLGLAINMEDALGLETSNLVLRGEAEFNFGKRNRSMVRFGYFGFFRSSKKVLESEITIGDQVFPIGTEVNSKFDIQIYKTTYDYYYFSDKRVRLGVSIGLYVMPITFSVKSINYDERASDFIAPLPVIGLNFNFAITPKLFIKQSIDVLYLQIADFTGNISDINARIEYNPFKNFGFGLGYNVYRLGISGDKENSGLLDFSGSIKTGYSGLLFYGKFFF
jgi:hypothetical protein